jgi:hypothetical protein
VATIGESTVGYLKTVQRAGSSRLEALKTSSTVARKPLRAPRRERRVRLTPTDMARAVAICDKLLKRRDIGDRDRGTAKLLRPRPDEVVFWPEDFAVFFTLAALEAGINVRAYGARLNPQAAKPELVPAAALRTVAQVARIYAEHPGALTLFKVQRALLVTMVAARVGIATGQVVDVPVISGALGGIGALLINILSERYRDDGAEPETDWLEEFILATLDRHGPRSIVDLHKLTNIHQPLLTRTLRGLIKKKLVAREYQWEGGRTVVYGVLKSEI